MDMGFVDMEVMEFLGFFGLWIWICGLWICVVIICFVLEVL